MIKRIIEGNNEIARFETWSRYPELQEKIELIQQAKLEIELCGATEKLVDQVNTSQQHLSL